MSTIIALAHSLRLKVVAEGVETEEQAKILRLLRCDEIQGYLISRPVPEREFVALLQPAAQGGRTGRWHDLQLQHADMLLHRAAAARARPTQTWRSSHSLHAFGLQH